jgi:glutamate:Na+ symporter, ESS family
MAGVNWEPVLIFCYLSVFLLLATFLRSRIKFLQKFLIPNSILAGLFGILLGQYLFKVIDPNQMGDYVYHLLTLAFIAMGLRGSKVKRSYGTLTTMVIHCQTYAVQGILGMVFALVLILTYFPDLFPAFGLHLVMGFGNNPGVAYSFGLNWESMGFVGGAQVGLTFGALGFIWAYIIGMVVINWGVRRNMATLFKGYDQIPTSVFRGIVKPGEEKKEAGLLVTAQEAIESMALQLALVGTVLLIAYLFLTNFLGFLESFGDFGHNLSALIGGFGYIFGILFALIIRWIMEKIKIDYIIDHGLMTRLGGTFIDFMITAAITAISLEMIRLYWLEITMLSTIGGFVTLGVVYFLVNRMQMDYKFERLVSSFGLVTGTVASGLALLRVLDPHFETPVAEDLVYAGGVALFTAIPILLMANMPAMGYMAGRTIPAALETIGLVLAYLAGLTIFWFVYRAIYLRRLKSAGDQ